MSARTLGHQDGYLEPNDYVIIDSSVKYHKIKHAHQNFLEPKVMSSLLFK